MAKSEPKTRPTASSVEDFLLSLDDDVRRDDALRVLELFKTATGEKPKMWGSAIVGFGAAPIEYADGSLRDWPMVAFSPRKQSLTLYVICASPKQPQLLAKLGTHTTSKACLYIKRLADVDQKVLASVIKDCYAYTKRRKGS